MYKAKKSLNIANAFSFNKYQSQILSLIGFMILSLISTSSFALLANPGANCNGVADAAQGALTNSDYNNLVTGFGTYVNVAGNDGGKIPLQMRVSTNESSTSTVKSNFGVITSDNKNAINIRRTFPTPSDYTDTKLEFLNSITEQPIYLTNVAISAFDIDYASSWGGSYFNDYVQITGVTEAGNTIEANLQPITGSNIDYSQGLYTANTSVNCPAKNLGTACQGSVQFSQPVASINIRYTNRGRFFRNPTNQEIDFRIDNYCYAPPSQSYEISKTDNVTSISTNNTTTYTIKVTNTGGNALQNIILKDPVVSGLSKQSNITCDTSDTANVCSTPPTVTQLERSTGFTIPTLAAGKSYSIKVPTLVTAASGTDVTNTATISHTTLADKSSSDTNSVTSIFDGGSNSQPAMCPNGHQMYYLGANKPDGAILPSNLRWSAGTESKEFMFDDITFELSFTKLFSIKTGYPTFNSEGSATDNALSLNHGSQQADVNHKMTAIIDRPVSKYGFVVQDLDTNESRRYVESISILTNGGTFSNYQTNRHKLSEGNQTISGIPWQNCSTSSTNKCDFNVDWGYKAAGTPFTVSHGNTYSKADNADRGIHTVGYSDFYFCLAPPKLIVKKELEGTRINDAANNTDQFQISVTDGSSFTNSFTTTGSGSTINNGSSSVLELNDNTTYTITERVMNSSTLGDIGGYSATYTCTNATTNSTTVMPSDDMTYDSANQTRSFTLSNVTYGDEITCTITNTPSQYTFSGIVFNDNGGISSEDKFDTSSTFTGNSSYFNGQFDSSIESGVSHLDLKVSLNDCNGTIIDATNSPNPQSIPISGQYSFIVQADKLPDNNTVCITEIEPDPWSDYPVDTTPNEYEFTLKSGLFNYKTGVQDNTGNTLNLDFGEVIRNQSALVLTKSQYVHQCDDTLDLTNPAINQPTSDPMVGFSDQPPSTNVDPGQCIAYKITATNRGNIDLNDIVVSDTLQKDGVGGATVTSTLADAVSTADGFATDRAIGYNGTISTQPFNLNGKAVRSFYFNTQYGK